MYTSRWKNLKQSKMVPTGSMCAGLDLKDAFLHVPIRPKVKKFLPFSGKAKSTNGKFYPFCLKSSLRILTFMVKCILHFLCSKKISLTVFMDDFTNQTKCKCKAIFNIHVIALVFMCCGWSITGWKPIWTPLRHRFILFSFGIPWKGLLPYQKTKPPQWKHNPKSF